MKATLGLAMIAAGAAAITTQVKAADDAIKIGVLTDLSGLYAAPTGPGSVFAARQAVADFVASRKGLKVEVVAGDRAARLRGERRADLQGDVEKGACPEEDESTGEARQEDSFHEMESTPG